jgi:hypothetical protein
MRLKRAKCEPNHKKGLDSLRFSVTMEETDGKFSARTTLKGEELEDGREERTESQYLNVAASA